jgi:HEAT repeat protein
VTVDPSSDAGRRRRVVLAGHTGDAATARAALADDAPTVRVAALGALDRLDALTVDEVRNALVDADPAVRRRAAELAGTRPEVDLLGVLDDPEATVVEVAAWATGEQEDVSDAVLTRVITLATDHPEPLVRESAAAALGAIGDERGLPAILAACRDKPAVRRRAVLALAPFEGEEVEAAIDAALTDRDWQVRQAAEDLRRAAG